MFKNSKGSQTPSHSVSNFKMIFRVKLAVTYVSCLIPRVFWLFVVLAGPVDRYPWGHQWCSHPLRHPKCGTQLFFASLQTSKNPPTINFPHISGWICKNLLRDKSASCCWLKSNGVIRSVGKFVPAILQLNSTKDVWKMLIAFARGTKGTLKCYAVMPATFQMCVKAVRGVRAF